MDLEWYDEPVTVEQVKNWVGSTWGDVGSELTVDNLCLLLAELANGEYEGEQFKHDIHDTWRSTQ
tara:strand:+ start:29 stop:223 length:195 start_codon:yes stop_codon:yes gene_type:complete